MEYSINDIESLTETQAKALASETLNIKGYKVYLIDFSGYFGFSACVFGNSHHIYYANDYELHHKGKSHTELKEWYIETLNNKLFTDEEIKSPIKNYQDYNKKDYYIRNYIPQKFDHESMFGIYHTQAEADKAHKETLKEYPYPCHACFSYFKDPKIGQYIVDLLTALEYSRAALENDFEYWKSAIKYEMYNHEYAINYQAEYDVINCFGRVAWLGDFTSLETWLNKSTLNETQKKAYRAALAEYNKESCNLY
jgi:hypothetical protein